MKPTAEQLKDPKWWDENSPVGAMYYDKSEGGEDAPFLKVNSYNQWRYWCPVNKKWKQIRSALIPNDSSVLIERPENFIGATDMVNHPPHYQSDSGIECIEAIRAALTPEEFRGYCKGNMIKYIWRERLKGGDESVEKAQWYGNQIIDAPTR